jgi:regulator of sigma E protease
MSVLISIIAFAAAISILVSFHEFGHYWVAKRLGVKVIRFSVGFGQTLWKRTAGPDRTEYVLAAIPLGGYVKMLDEREGPVDVQEQHRAFNRQKVTTRIFIVAAGPLFNFLLAIVAYWLMFMLGVTGVKPVVGQVAPDTIAARAGLRAGDEIVAVGDTRAPTWETASIAIVDQALDQGNVKVKVRSRRSETSERVLKVHDTRKILGTKDLFSALGIIPWQPATEPILGKLMAGGAAKRGGLHSGDRIIKADGKVIAQWQDWVNYVRARPHQTIRLKIERNGSIKKLILHTGVTREEGQRIGRIGAYPHLDREQIKAMQVEVRYGPIAAFGIAAAKTWELSALTVRVLWKLVTGQASLKNVSGPITIARYAGVSALIGVSAFLGALAVFSISIAVLNLLPVPVLDGGHLFYYFIELIKGSPVSDATEAIGQRIGLAMLAGLMALALYNDFSRLLG